MAKQTNIFEDIAAIGDIVTAARDLVEEGQVINIQPLEKEVEDLCERLTKVDVETARGAQPALLCLIDELSRLGQTMEERHQTLSGELRSLASHSNAASAYSARPAKPGRST